MGGTENMFEGFDFTNFWEDSAYALEEYVSKPPSDELLLRLLKLEFLIAEVI